MPNTELLSLQLFADEGGAVGGGETVSSGDAAATPADATVSTGDQPAEESWDSLIKGRYKKDYDRAVREAVNKRFRSQQDLQGRLNAVDPIMQTLATKYGVAPAPDGSIDLNALTAAVQNDDAMFQEEAFQRGMSVQDLRQLKQLERENAQFKAQARQSAEEAEWQNVLSQGEAVKQIYPDFDITEELQNDQFGRLLATFQKAGMPNAVQTAYEAVHREEIMGGAMQYAVQRTQQQISNSIQSGMRRPAENGTSSQSTGTVSGVDPSKLTKSQIDDIKMRAQRGERIVF